MEKQKNKKAMPIIIIFMILILVAAAVFLFYKRVPTTIAEAKEMEYHTNENITLMDDYGNTIILPAGFKIALDSENVVTKGVVIEDVTETATNGSQFVWIPVTKQDGTKIKMSEGDTEGFDNPLIRYMAYTDGRKVAFEDLPDEAGLWKNLLEEVKTDTGSGKYGNAIAKDIEDFCSKVGISGGFYIGRYEASSNENTITTKKDQNVYANITQNNAATLCQQMYTDKPFTSDLINSYVWDTTINFIEKCGGYSNYGHINASTKFAKTGENGDEILKINDMSGNAYEWSTESGVSEENSAVARGGGFWDVVSENTNSRCAILPFGRDYISFRPILYM